jgi:hypothetical protein
MTRVLDGMPHIPCPAVNPRAPVAAFRDAANCCLKVALYTVADTSTSDNTWKETITPAPPRYGVHVPHDTGQKSASVLVFGSNDDAGSAMLNTLNGWAHACCTVPVGPPWAEARHWASTASARPCAWSIGPQFKRKGVKACVSKSKHCGS